MGLSRLREIAVEETDYSRLSEAVDRAAKVAAGPPSIQNGRAQR